MYQTIKRIQFKIDHKIHRIKNLKNILKILLFVKSLVILKSVIKLLNILIDNDA